MAELSNENDGWDDKEEEPNAPTLSIAPVPTAASLTGPLDSGIKRPSSVELSRIKI
jgi:hypothetical protein